MWFTPRSVGSVLISTSVRDIATCSVAKDCDCLLKDLICEQVQVIETIFSTSQSSQHHTIFISPACIVVGFASRATIKPRASSPVCVIFAWLTKDVTITERSLQMLSACLSKPKYKIAVQTIWLYCITLMESRKIKFDLNYSLLWLIKIKKPTCGGWHKIVFSFRMRYRFFARRFSVGNEETFSKPPLAHC